MSDPRREKEELRKQRAAIDRQILALLDQRAKLSKDWAASHSGQGTTLPSTERDSLDDLAASAGDLPPDAVRAIFREIHTACRALEAPIRVAFLGPEGGYGWVAARRQFGPSAQYIPAPGVAEALASVAARRADFALLPYESASEGPVHATLLALRETDLRIVATNEVETVLCLMNRSGSVADVQKVFATAKDHAAAQKGLLYHVPNATVVDVKSPLVACQLAAEDPSSAAVAVEAAGRPLDLAVAAQGTADGTRIRFSVVSGRPASRTGKDATAILFTASDEPGALFEVLKHFAERGINLRKIHSRPAPHDGGGYLFFLEVSGHVTDRHVVAALEEVKRHTKTMKILGSYPL